MFDPAWNDQIVNEALSRVVDAPSETDMEGRRRNGVWLMAVVRGLFKSQGPVDSLDQD